MEKYIDIMKQSTELLGTVHEGLLYTQNLLKEGKFEETIPLFRDVVQAFSTIENSLTILPKETLSDDLNDLTLKVKSAFEIVVGFYEKENYGKIQEVLQFTLIPRYNKWVDSLDMMFRQYLVS